MLPFRPSILPSFMPLLPQKLFSNFSLLHSMILNEHNLSFLDWIQVKHSGFRAINVTFKKEILHVRFHVNNLKFGIKWYYLGLFRETDTRNHRFCEFSVRIIHIENYKKIVILGYTS